MPTADLVGAPERPHGGLGEVRERVLARAAPPARAAGGHRRALQRRHGRAAHAPPGAAGRPLAARLLAIRDRIALSGRGHDRVLRVARTIADLEGRELVAETRRRRGALLPARRAGSGSARDVRQLRRLSAPRLPDRSSRPAHRGTSRPGAPRRTGLLALPEEELIAAAAGRQVERALAFLDALRRGRRARAARRSRQRSWPCVPFAALSATAPRPAGPAGGPVRMRRRRMCSTSLARSRP